MAAAAAAARGRRGDWGQGTGTSFSKGCGTEKWEQNFPVFAVQLFTRAHTQHAHFRIVGRMSQKLTKKLKKCQKLKKYRSSKIQNQGLNVYRLGFHFIFTLSTKFEVNFCLFLNRPPTQPRLTIKCTLRRCCPHRACATALPKNAPPPSVVGAALCCRRRPLL